MVNISSTSIANGLITKYKQILHIKHCKSFHSLSTCNHKCINICPFLRSPHSLNRHLREQASIALKNISTNPDRTSAFSALSQVAVNKLNTQDETSWDSDSSGIFSSSEKNLQRQSTSSCSRTSSNSALMDGEGGSKAQRTISELTSLLTLVFQSDALGKSGSERQFLSPGSSSDLRYTRLKKPNNFREREKYLCSLRLLTNCLVVMSNVLLISENMENTSRDEFLEGRYVSYFPKQLHRTSQSIIQQSIH